MQLKSLKVQIPDMKKIKLLCFDLDDTLWLSRPVIEHAEQVFYNYLSDMTPELTKRFSPESLRDHRAEYLSRHPELEHQISQWRTASLTEALTLSGYQSQSADLARQAFAVFLEARQEITLFPHCEDIIGGLSEDYMLISLTNGNADLGRQAVGKYFSANYQAEHVKAAKPSPELFLKALEIADCRADEAIHIGDHVIDDISGAKALGLLAIQACMKPDSPLPHALADDHFHDWRDLPGKIQQLSSH
jgi:HAD superfamily hydrolase (TIGR01549 family)